MKITCILALMGMLVSAANGQSIVTGGKSDYGIVLAGKPLF